MSSNRVCRSCARILPRIGSRIRWNSGCLATERVESSNGLQTCESNSSVNHVRCSLGILGSSLLKRASSQCVQLTLGHAGMRRNPFRNFHSTTDEGASSDGDTVVTEPTPHQSPQTKCTHITSQPQEPLTAEERAAVHSEPMNRSGHSSPQVAQTESETADIGLQSSSEKTVGGYTYDELLERIAKAQLQRNERVVDTQEKLEKKREKLLRKTVMNIDELIDFLREERAHDICVIKVPPEREYVDYFVVCGGLGTRHIRTMADNLVTEMKGCGDGRGGRVRVEGRDSDEWMAVNLGFAVVHMMLDEARNKYELEKLWALGPQYDDQLQNLYDWYRTTDTVPY